MLRPAVVPITSTRVPSCAGTDTVEVVEIGSTNTRCTMYFDCKQQILDDGGAQVGWKVSLQVTGEESMHHTHVRMVVDVWTLEEIRHPEVERPFVVADGAQSHQHLSHLTPQAV
jgi:hypothetical protein